MTMRSAWRRTLKAVTLAVAMLGAACGGIVDGTSETGYRTIGSAGGEVKAKDAVVTLPEGAVDSALTVTIAPAPTDQLPEGAAGKVVDVGPEGAEFLQPVTVQLAFDPDALPDPSRTDLTWVGGEVDGEWEPLLDPVVDDAARVVRGTTRRAGRFGVVHGCGRGRRCPVQLDFDSAPQRVEAGACSGATVLKTTDASGRRSPVQHDTAVALSADEPSVRFYGDATCQREISALSIPARQTDATFYFRGRTARSVTLTAQARDLRPGTQDETIYPGTGVSFSIVTAPQRVAAHACSSAVTVAFEDALGNRSPVPNDARVTLSFAPATSAVTLYSDDTCTTPTAGVTMPGGTASASFWFKDDLSGSQSETITLTASVGAFGGGFTATQDETVDGQPPNPATALQFSSAPQTIMAGACSAATTVGVVDASGNRTVVTASTTVAFQTSPGMGLYSDSACTAGTNVATIAAGTGSTTVYFKAPNAGTYTITATSTGLASASQAETVQAPPSTALQFSTPAQTVAPGACSAATRVGLVDAFGNPVVAGASTTVTLSASPGTMTFFADVNCAVQASSVTIPAGTNSATFSFRASTAGTYTVTASSAGLTSASQVETVQTPGPATALRFFSLAQTVQAGFCSASTMVGLVDSSGNRTPAAASTTVSLQSSSGAMSFYADIACTTPIASSTIPAGSISTTFYFKSPVAGSPTITTSSAGLTSASQVETIN